MTDIEGVKLERLADLTGREGENRITRVIEDALLVYEWILAQQAVGRTVVALEPPAFEALAHDQELHGRRPALSEFLAPSRKVRAQEYFSRASA